MDSQPRCHFCDLFRSRQQEVNHRCRLPCILSGSRHGDAFGPRRSSRNSSSSSVRGSLFLPNSPTRTAPRKIITKIKILNSDRLTSATKRYSTTVNIGVIVCFERGFTNPETTWHKAQIPPGIPVNLSTVVPIHFKLGLSKYLQGTEFEKRWHKRHHGAKVRGDGLVGGAIMS